MRKGLSMPEEFRSLEELLRGPVETEQCESARDVDEAAPQDELEEAQTALVRDVRLFRANLAERVDAAVETLLREIACDVLARELCIEPACIGAIVRSALERYCSEEPVCVRVNPFDVARVPCNLPVVADDALREGDAIIEVRGGEIDASLGVRLDAVLRAVTR
jgi:flagellar biosynthesis/type III secretory pathway protein FliH